MPTSHPEQINELLSVILNTYARNVLDVGVGFGKFGVLCREYLDISDGRESYADWQCRIDGIEAHEAYITPLHKFVYNTVYVGNALTVLPTLEARYDLTLMVDVLEHFSQVDGMQLLRGALARSRGVLLSTPKDIGTQGSAFGNEFETHRFQWKAHHFKDLGPHFVVRNRRSLIVYIGPDATRVRLRRHPRLLALYRRFRGAVD